LAKKKLSAVALLRAASSPDAQRRGSYDPDSKAASVEAQRELAGAFANAREQEVLSAERAQRKQQEEERIDAEAKEILEQIWAARWRERQEREGEHAAAFLAQ